MSNITLRIGGRSYTVACADGQEAHITGLGQAIDAKLSSMGSTAGQNEARTLLFAALLLADEVYELKAGLTPLPNASSSVAPALEALADRLEKVAAGLEG